MLDYTFLVMMELVPIAKELDTARTRPMYLSSSMIEGEPNRMVSDTDSQKGVAQALHRCLIRSDQRLGNLNNVAQRPYNHCHMQYFSAPAVGNQDTY